MRLPGVLPCVAVGALLAAAGLLNGCKRAPPTAASISSTDRPSDAQSPTLGEAEQRYGVSPRHSQDVTYQPDVIVMEHGANAIRSQTPDGFTWTLDAAAPGVSQIQVGKILFATGRVVGRVLKVERNGDGVRVTLGPAELTDIFEEVHISTHGSLDPEKMIVYVAPPGYPGSFRDQDAPEHAPPAARATHSHNTTVQVYTVSRSGEFVALRSTARNMQGPPCDADARGQFRAIRTLYIPNGENAEGFSGDCARFTNAGATAADIAGVVLDGFSIRPSMSGGLQAATSYKSGGLIFNARTKIRLDQPKFTFRLDILHGLKTAAIEFTGVGGLEVGMEAGTSDALKNINEVFAVPIDISFPIAGPVPFAATFHQSLLVQTLFTAKQGTLSAKGDYSLGGTITAGIINGTPVATAPLFVTSNTTLASELNGASLGVNGLVLGYGGKLIIGLGSFGVIVGPYASINASLGITRGSDLATGLVAYTCRSSTLDLFLDYGLGFAIPNWAAKAVSAFLGLFHAKPISTTYGTKLGTVAIKHLDEAVPPSCAAKPAA